MIYVVGACGLIVALVLWKAYSAGAKAKEAAAAKETLHDLQNISRPGTDADVERVRGKYRRD